MTKKNRGLKTKGQLNRQAKRKQRRKAHAADRPTIEMMVSQMRMKFAKS